MLIYISHPYTYCIYRPFAILWIEYVGVFRYINWYTYTISISSRYIRIFAVRLSVYRVAGYWYCVVLVYIYLAPYHPHSLQPHTTLSFVRVIAPYCLHILSGIVLWLDSDCGALLYKPGHCLRRVLRIYSIWWPSLDHCSYKPKSLYTAALPHTNP